MEFSPFSEKQLRALNWWCPGSTDAGRDAIICDGAVRSGKTLCLGISFVMWACGIFSGRSFALCGKTIRSLKRNLVTTLLPALAESGFSCRFKVGENLIEIGYGKNRNRFYLFGGKDEGSAALIQGITLAGVFFDEAALMPRTFVEQALARCSVEGSKFWFNCNPESPNHWFYREWIQKAEEKNALLLHFTMEDNPSLSRAVRRRYRGLYSGVFYERFVLGKWVAAEGLVYPFMTDAMFCGVPEGRFEKYAVSCDYGTVNPCSAGLWGRKGGVWYRVALEKDFLRFGSLAQPGIAWESLKAASQALSVPDLRNWGAVFRRQAEKMAPLTPQLAGSGKQKREDGNEPFRI